MMQVIELGQHVHDGQAEQRVYALVGPGETPSVHLLPDSPKSLALLNASSTPLHFWRLNATTGGLAYPASNSTHASLAAAMQYSLHAKIAVGTHLLLPGRAIYSGSAFNDRVTMCWPESRTQHRITPSEEYTMISARRGSSI